MKLHAVKIPSGGVWRLEMGTFAAMLLAKMQMPMIDNVHHLQDVGKGRKSLEYVGIGQAQLDSLISGIQNDI